MQIVSGMPQKRHSRHQKEIMEVFAQSAQWRIEAETPSDAMAEPSRTDQELLRQLARGNETAFKALYGRYQGPIYRFSLHMSGNPATAEEVTQEVFMLLINNPKAYQPDKGSLAGYLFGIARNVTRQRLRQQCLDVAIDDGDGEEDPALASDLDILEELTQAELLDCLRKAILSLPELYREALVLCDLEEKSYAESAEILECSPGTVASRLHRARAILKAKLSCQKCAK
jgi:RNA polymerase sigma-70 factor (ECF subfamily)